VLLTDPALGGSNSSSTQGGFPGTLAAFSLTVAKGQKVFGATIAAGLCWCWSWWWWQQQQHGVGLGEMAAPTGLSSVTALTGVLVFQ
jgi:hypothetical protein